MPSPRFYVRTAGQVSGPFDALTLRAHAQAGKLLPTSELSIDQQNWKPASKYTQLFTPAARPTPAPAPPSPPTSRAPTAAPAAPAEPATYYYQLGEDSHGPLTLTALRALASSGQLPPDALVWQDGDAASNIARKHPALISIFARTAPAAPASPAARAPTAPADEYDLKPADAPRAGDYYLEHNGETEGPYSLDSLLKLAHSNSIDPDDLVWKDGDAKSYPAHSHPLLTSIIKPRTVDVPVFDRPEVRAGAMAGGLIGGLLVGAISGAMSASNKPASRNRPGKFPGDSAARLIGLILGPLLFIFLFLPWMENKGSYFWWWTFFSAPVFNGPIVILIFLAIFYLLGSVALTIFSVATRGPVRALIYMSTASLGLLLWMILPAVTVSAARGRGGFNAGAYSPPFFAFFVGLFLLTSLGALIAVARARAKAPHPDQNGRIAQLVCGCIACVLAVIGLIYHLMHPEHLGMLPAVLILADMLSLLAKFTALAAGILAIVGVIPRFSRGRNMLAGLLAAGALLIYCFSEMLLFAGIINAGAMFFFAAFRILFCIAALLPIFTVGLREFLGCFYNQASARNAPPGFPVNPP